MDKADLEDAFNRAHERAFGHADLEAPIQVVNLRVSSSRQPPDIRLPFHIGAPHLAEPDGNARLFTNGVWTDALIYQREHLKPEATMVGPAIVVQSDTTLLIPVGWKARVDGFRNIEMEFV
jgi:N-methylhydantoinase A/oxoprolinase/acetone carboxylase beta subunit